MATTITLDEARERFGEIMHAATRTYREFDGDDGIWRPLFMDGELIGYRLYQLHRVKRARPRRR